MSLKDIDWEVEKATIFLLDDLEKHGYRELKKDIRVKVVVEAFLKGYWHQLEHTIRREYQDVDQSHSASVLRNKINSLSDKELLEKYGK